MLVGDSDGDDDGGGLETEEGGLSPMPVDDDAVSYTHLTLPTILLV